ncbi:MAG TPA: hypothetical protein VGE52_02485 [Pirellulales bacterium]
MPEYLLTELTKEKWKKLKTDHDMKKKGALAKIFTKLTGINVGDKIDKFQTAKKAMQTKETPVNLKAAAKAALSLSEALTKYANEKTFATLGAQAFQQDVRTWAADARKYAGDLLDYYNENKDLIDNNDVDELDGMLENQGFI